MLVDVREMEGAKKKSSLEELAEAYWEVRMRNDPLYSTVLGDRRFDDRLPDITPSGISRAMDDYRTILGECDELDGEALAAPEQLTRAALSVELGGMIDFIGCHLESWTVDPLEGWQVQLQNIESFQPVRSPAEGRSLVMRWSAVGPLMDAHIENLRKGLASGKTAVEVEVKKVLEETDDLLGKPEDEWAFLRPLRESHEGWSEEERRAFREGVRSATKDAIYPAFARYSRFLRTELLPKARGADRPGLMYLEGGVEAYARLINFHTSLDLTPDELHRTGMREVAKINSEMESLGEKVFGDRDRKKTIDRLRTDRSLYFSTRDEVAEKAERALRKAQEAIPRWFGRLPKARCEVVRMEEHEEKHSTIAYYRQPAADGSRPGRYYINTSAPETRPRYEAEVLAYHESIPGHHLQIAIAQELEGMPAFRKYGGVTAFVEGWGLYTERLSEEMGLYTDDLDRIGVLSYDSWRACRLVVDTGMHAKGWTRDQAIAFMLENTALAKNNIVNEVDRYIAWPGQALAYKTGQLELVRLRGEAEARPGSRFDVKRFHDDVLKNGALPLPALRKVLGQPDSAR
ncbi:MAG: DUF885 domain-containing protein [Thaumarchaeota archaeon]|nr:DUF885 domain-containing protein [Nitrososphaerota archaeon]